MSRSASKENIFINCPFDGGYQPLFDAIIFVVIDCGCIPRCALEADDSAEARIEKIARIIEASRLGIHDISCTELDVVNGLPRFNMPLELGLFLGAKRFGNPDQKTKVGLILDTERYRYQKFISDIAGQDIKAHSGEAEQIITQVRNWLHSTLIDSKFAGGRSIFLKYQRFRKVLPQLCEDVGLVEPQLTFKDYCWMVHDWLEKLEP